MGCDFIGLQGGLHGKLFRWRLFSSVLPFDGPQSKSRGKDGEKSISMELQRRAVRESDQPECEQFIPSDAFMMFTPKVNDRLPDQGSAERADAEARENCQRTSIVHHFHPHAPRS